MVNISAMRSVSSTVAYFSMEVAIDPGMPTYSGGLGVLAGDTLRAAADLGVPMVGMTLLYRKGYFHQQLDASGNQTENPADWSPEEFMQLQSPKVKLVLEGREVRICAWRYLISGESGHTVPVYFLDTSLPENNPQDQGLTHYLYGGDQYYRLCQEIILGLGGIAILRALGHNVQTYHMNEGHSALLTLALLEQEIKAQGQPSTDLEANRETVRRRCIFTTHTPVPAGHDQFPMDMVRQVLGKERTDMLNAHECCFNGFLNMTYLALSFSHYINGVAMRHGEVSRIMFTGYPINSITNGVHASSWAVPSFHNLYDRYIPEWRKDNLYLRYAISIPLEEIVHSHTIAKHELFAEVARRAGIHLDPTKMTLGFARRATAYKRADLLFNDLERLRHISQEVGPIQLIYGGKAHPADEGGKDIIRRVFAAIENLRDLIPVVYLEEYDMRLAKYLCSGVDLWLNTPQKPYEASGTSGMKAAINGVPSLSVLDGWWIEGHIEGITGWSIGDSWQEESNPSFEATSLYDKMENVILPMFYNRPRDFAEIMRSAIAINGSFFNAQRMLSQYVRNAYLASK